MKKQFFFSCVSMLLLTESCQKSMDNNISEAPYNKSMSVANSGSFLLRSNVALADWMSQLPDATYLNTISIPGAHDAGARFETVYGTAKCQNLTLPEQLKIGTRFLDIRCRHINNSFAIHHGPIYQNLNFQALLSEKTDP